MSKKERAFVCSDCGEEYAKWQGRCFNCGSWETITEFHAATPKNPAARAAATGTPAQVHRLSECDLSEVSRLSTGYEQIDRVLGGGIVPGAMILVGGDPGIGKSTLLLQIMAGLCGAGHTILYVSGEESAQQLSLHGRRLGIAECTLALLTETNLSDALATLRQLQPSVVVVDSIQTVFTDTLESAPGSVSQVRECTGLLLQYAKQSHTAIFLVGHVTKEGAIAGPRVLEHMVDTVLSFEGDANYQYRILRAAKNRFGPSGELALLSMSDNGLQEVHNCSELFVLNREKPLAGTAFVPVLEGSRIMVIELQALVNLTHFGMPQRVASGINPKKLALLVAVLERYTGTNLGEHDIFFNIAGGLTIGEPAIDLGIAAALLSSFANRPLRTGLALCGEIGLGGEIRPVNHMALRLKELARMGFTHCIVPPPTARADWAALHTSITFVHCPHINTLPGLIC